MTQFIDTSDDDMALMIKQSHEFMSIIRVIAANSVTHTNSHSKKPMPQDLELMGCTKIIEGDFDDSQVVQSLIPGFVALLKTNRGVAKLFEHCATVPPEENMVKKVAENFKERARIRDEKLKANGIEVTEIPGMGVIVSHDPDTKLSLREITDLVFGNKKLL